jgi:hypothetical protein
MSRLPLALPVVSSNQRHTLWNTVTVQSERATTGPAKERQP